MEDNHAKPIISELGGVRAVCDFIASVDGQEVKHSTARMWAYRGRIPWKFRPHIIDMAASQGKRDEIASLLPGHKPASMGAAQ